MVCFKIYSKIYNWFANELLLILKEIYSDYCRAYNGLANCKALANYRVRHSKNKFANNHINSIKNLWVMLNVDYINLNG